jgi:sugar phosphate isomerase/epimerase
MIQLAFSKPTNEEDARVLFKSFHKIGYDGLQLKAGQYTPYLNEPERFLNEWGRYPGAASALITWGPLNEAGVGRLRSVFRFGKAVGSEMVIFCHDAPREQLSSGDIRGFAREISELGKEAQDCGLRLSLHNHYGQPVMHREDFGIFFDAVGEDTVGLTLDTAHLVKSGVRDIAGVIREMRNVIDNFHLKDFRDGQFEVLGKGEIDFKPVFAAIREIGYDGWVSTDEESGAALLPAMETCYEFMADGLDL